MKPLPSITIDDFRRWPVWEYVPEDEGDEPLLRQVAKLPVHDLSNRIVGTRVVLSNGTGHWGMLGNITLNDKRSTEQFLTLSIEHNSKWFDLARYHDVDYTRRGPPQLAQFLGLETDAIFPIAYDISALAHGLPAIVKGAIPVHPSETLSQDELISLAVRGR